MATSMGTLETNERCSSWRIRGVTSGGGVTSGEAIRI